MNRHQRWVLHSAYPDGGWRGIEKCMGDNDGNLLLFDTEEDAADHARRSGSTTYFSPREVELRTPSVWDKDDDDDEPSIRGQAASAFVRTWFQVSRRYRTVACLPPGTTGIEALARAALEAGA